MNSMTLTFVGTGASCALPVIGHLNEDDRCVCREATEDPTSKNRRNNVSMLVSLPRGACTATSLSGAKVETKTSAAGDMAHVLIDCGKSFRNAYFRVLAPRGICCVDALLITHGHADAMQCVEEVCALHTETRRSWQTQHGSVPSYLERVPTYLTPPTFKQVGYVSPELARLSSIEKGSSSHFSDKMGEANAEAALDVTSASALGCLLDVHYLPEDIPTRFYIPSLSPDIPMYSLPVEHGKGYISLGFVFGKGTAFRSAGTTADQVAGTSCVVYISDISEAIPASLAFLQDLVKIDVLIFDLLAERGRRAPPHTCWDDVMPFVKQTLPHRTYCVGMFCSLEQDASNREWVKELAEAKAAMRDAAMRAGNVATEAERRFLAEVESIELAYDGLELVLDL